MSGSRKTVTGRGSGWSYSYSTCNGVTTFQSSGNVPPQYLQKLGIHNASQKSIQNTPPIVRTPRIQNSLTVVRPTPQVTNTSSYPVRSTQPTIQNASSSSGSISSSNKHQKRAESMKDYHEYGLYLHNWYRKRHGSPKMVLDGRLNKAADAYAYQLACRGALQHTSGLDYNENLYMSSDKRLSKNEHVRQACKCWYDEIKYYNFNKPGFSMQTGHFTAMVFKSCKQLGIGVGVADKWVVVVGNYKPHANIQDHFPTNVLPYRHVEDSDDE